MAALERRDLTIDTGGVDRIFDIWLLMTGVGA